MKTNAPESAVLHDDVRGQCLETMDTAQLVAVAEELDTDDFADILQQLPEQAGSRKLDSVIEPVESATAPEDSAGG